MKKILFHLLLATAFLASCNRESKDERFCRQAREFTKTSCPKPMDQYTVLDSLVYSIESKTMMYHYSVSGLMDTVSVYNSEMLSLFHSNLLENIRHNIGLIELKQHAVTFHYRYVSSTGKTEYMSFTFTPKDYE